MVSIINSKIRKKKQELFVFFANNSCNDGFINFEKTNNTLKMAIVLHKLRTNCQNLFDIYNFFRFCNKNKCFQKWKENLNFQKQMTNVDNNIKLKYSQIYDEKIKVINKEINNSQKSIDDLKESEKSLSQSIKQKEKDKEHLLKKEKNLCQKIEQIKKENIQLEKEKNEKETLTNSNTYTSFFPSKKEGNEEIIKELEKKLKELEDEEIERTTYMEEYSEEMSKMMSIFEQKAQEIMRLQNNGGNGHQQRRLEINTGSYDSTNPGSECNFSENLKNKKNTGREQSTGHKNVNNNQDMRPNSKNKNKNSIGNNNVFGNKNAPNSKDGFVNRTENFGNKI